MKRPSKFARWFRPFAIDLRALAAMRIIIGIATLYDCVHRLRVARVFFTDDGITPRSLFLGGGQKWQSLYSISGSYGWAIFLLLIHGILALLFTVGYQTRVVTAALFVSVWSLINRNPTMAHGGHNLEAWLLVWSVFLPLGAVASIDAATARRGPRVRRVANIASAAILIQLVLMYWNALAVKANPEWRSDFTAVYYFLNSHLATPLGYLIGQAPEICYLLTIATVGIELLGPLCALLLFRFPVLRTALVVKFIVFHLMLVATMYVGSFSFICIAAWMLFVPRSTWDAMGRVGWLRWIMHRWNQFTSRVAKLIEQVPAVAVRTIPYGPRSPITRAAVAALLAYVVVVNFIGFLPKSLGSKVGALGRLPRMKQSWSVMDSAWKYFHVIELEVELQDGNVHTLESNDAPDGSFNITLAKARTPEEYFTWRTWFAETTFLVGHRSILLLGAVAQTPAVIETYCEFHKRKWNEYHASPDKQVASIRVYATLFQTPPPDALIKLPATSSRQLIHTWRAP